MPGHFGEQIACVLGVAPQSTAAATVNGASVNRLTSGYHMGTLTASTGAVTGAPSATSVVVKVQDSADDSAWADVSGLTFTIAAASTTSDLNVTLAGLRQYVRAVATVSFTGGSSPTVLISGTWLMMTTFTNPI